MKFLIILLCVLITAMAAWLLVRPESLTRLLLRNAGRTWMHVLAAAVRIVLGALLVLYADQSRFPVVLAVIGWFAIAAGVVLALMPPSRFQSLVEWAFERFGAYVRVAAAAAVAFGLFLIYAVL
ncbi:MAG: hypothetical protein KJO33_00980 [Gammaproteobacteria bacterium]|nr:hypothetical protein [Gammaproteobacteria bacterium]MBT8064135.1 hypothetical protein [Gammaproteobacteria bacterium]NNK33430.1 hypothetical protein [Xanthomonadales bacterium]